MEHEINSNIKIIFSIGSNIEQRKNIDEAKRLLKEYVPCIKYSTSLWTDPINIISGQFLNCLGITETTLAVDDILNILKRIENACESSHEDHKSGHVKVDIDLLLYGNTKYHIDDWNRPYIHILYNEICNSY